MNNNAYRIVTPQKIDHNTIVEAIVPGSKSITNRALLLAAVAEGTSELKGCLTSDDAKHFLTCLKTLGFPVTEESDGLWGSNITITGFGGAIPNKKAEIYVGSAGTAARFLVAMLAFSDGEYIVNSSEQMKKRPMQPLLDSLRSAGALVECMEEEGHFPIHIRGAQNRLAIPSVFEINIDKSSQFLSALLISVGTLHKKAEIAVTGNHGLSYVDMTAKMMKTFGVSVTKAEVAGKVKYLFSGDDSYSAQRYDVEPDMSAAAYFYSVAALLGTKVCVRGVTTDMLQGDIAFLEVLSKMGCEVKLLDNKISVFGPENLYLKGGFIQDMSAFSDQALTLAAIAPFADAPITITGIGHIRLQECDRIRAIVDNLAALGIRTEERSDSVKIYPGDLQGCSIETFEDHRVAMSFALTGLRTEKIEILNPTCCKKTFAQYFEELERIVSMLTL